MGFSDVYRSVLKDYPDVLTVEEMSRALGVSTKTGYKLIRENKIESLKVGRSYRIPKAQPSFVYALGYEILAGFLIAHWTSAAEPDKLVSANSRSPIDLHKGGIFLW